MSRIKEYSVILSTSYPLEKVKAMDKYIANNFINSRGAIIKEALDEWFKRKKLKVD